MPKVSVIIPTFNRAWAVKKAIDSVLAQDFKNFELIVVDDGSYDSTKEILKSYGDKIITITQDNTGVSSARNKGIKLSQSEFISFLDSDDIWLPQKLSEQIKFFDLNPEALICQTEEIWIRNGVRVNPKNKHKKLSGMIFEQSLELCLISPSSVMLKKSLLEEIGLFDESLPACEDYDLWLRVTCRYPVHLIEKDCLFKYGGHYDQLSRQPCLDSYRIKAIEKILKSGLSDEYYKAALYVLHKKCSIYSKGCLKHGNIEEAFYYQKISNNFKM
ncbi:MAG: glycosyltransferase [Desulfobacterales bacterium]|nr:glycosyltransferase [Desulfobacterales bacterium]